MMRSSRSCLFALLVCPVLALACGGTAPRPKDASGAGGSEATGGAGGDETGGTSGQGGQAGQGGDGGAGGAGGGTGGGGGGSTGGRGGAGGSTAGRGGAGGSAAGTGGSGTGGSTGGSGTGGSTGGAGGSPMGSDASSPPADAPPGTDTAPPVDMSPPDAAPLVDAAATCGNVTCPRLWQLVESCRPMGACTEQSTGVTVNRCYANDVKVRARVNPLTSTINTTFIRPGGASCYLMDSPLPGAGTTQTLVFKELDSTEVARATINGPVISIRCGGGNAQVLTDETCLPPFSLNECTPGLCQ